MTKKEAEKCAREYFKTSEQPNLNSMLIGQVNGCIGAAIRLLEQLRPKTEQVDGCITTLKSWQDNNLKHLQKAFE